MGGVKETDDSSDIVHDNAVTGSNFGFGFQTKSSTIDRSKAKISGRAPGKKTPGFGY